MKKAEKIIWIVTIVLISAADGILQFKGMFQMSAVIVNIASVVALSCRIMIPRLFSKKK